MIVVDASVALKWTVKEVGHELAIRLLTEASRIGAPDLIISEVTNALRKKVRASEISLSQAGSAVDFISDAIDELFPAREVAVSALSMSVAMDHPAYDCFYLACALHWQSVLVTADDRFRDRCVAAGYGTSVLSVEDWLSHPPISTTPVK